MVDKLEYKRVLGRTPWVGSRWNPWNITGFSVESPGWVLDATHAIQKDSW